MKFALVLTILCAEALAQTNAPVPIDPDATRYRSEGTVTFAEPPERLVSEIDPVRLLDDLRLVYREAPIAERLIVTLLSAEDARTETIDLYLLEERAVLVMPPLTVEAIDEGEAVRIKALHARDDERFVETTVEAATLAAALRSFLPALPVPQIDLALQPAGDPDPAAEPKPDRITAWAPAVTWERGLLLPDETPPAAAVVGMSSNGASVELLIDGESNRLLRAVIDMPSRARRIDIEVEPLDPESVPPPHDAGGRTVVARLGALDPAPPERPLPDRLDLLVFDLDASPVRLPGDIDAPLLVVIFRQPEGADAARLLVAAAELAAMELDEAPAIRRVVILEREDRPDLDLLAQAIGEDLLWSPDPARTIGTLEEQAKALLLVYGKGGVLRAALSGQDAKDAAGVSARIMDSLRTD